MKDTHREFMFKLHLQAIDWVKYSEAKNGAILTISAILAATLTRFILIENLDSLIQGYFLLVLFSCLIVVGISLFSLLPRHIIPVFMIFGKPHKDDSPFFFGDVAKHDEKSLYRIIAPILGEECDSQNESHYIFLDQIIKNSKIAFYKNKLSLISIKILILSLFPVVSIFIFTNGRAGSK
ncbi:hypothetical protein IMCC1989_2487 [gamma proteobacterium IMCC1989]|nr:hypothetical protein IMCC1989_2487 [gamma proteobacterium IMCC1989]